MPQTPLIGRLVRSEKMRQVEPLWVVVGSYHHLLRKAGYDISARDLQHALWCLARQRYLPAGFDEPNNNTARGQTVQLLVGILDLRVDHSVSTDELEESCESGLQEKS